MLIVELFRGVYEGVLKWRGEKVCFRSKNKA